MATRDRSPVQGPQPLAAGEYRGTCLGVTLEVSAAGNQMNVWVFEAEGHEVRRYCVTKGPGAADTHETAMALGLGTTFRRSEAKGRKCILVLSVDGSFNRIERTKPLAQ